MNGKIKMYNNEKGYGFIYSDDGDIFFHVKSFVDQSVIPCVGMQISFDFNVTPKGKEAYNIQILKNASSDFIEIGDLRFRASNISSYGIAADNLVWLQEKIDTEILLENDDDKKLELQGALNALGLIAYRRCLYIKTYQKEEYSFYEKEMVDFFGNNIDLLSIFQTYGYITFANFNLDEKLAEIDAIMKG